MSFLTILLGIIIIILALVFLLGPAIVGISLFAEDEGWWWLPLGILVSTTVLAFYIWLGGTLGIKDNNREHCGPGTTYVSETHIVGKTPVTTWYCEAR